LVDHREGGETGQRTLLSQSPALVVLKLLVVAGALDGGVAAGAGQGDLHGLLEQLEALDLLDGALGGVGAVKDDKGLALGLQVRLGDNVDDGAILGEDGLERGTQRLGLDALLEVAHVHTAHKRARTAGQYNVLRRRICGHQVQSAPGAVCVGVQ
jgi:hypothetical protein